MGLHSTPTVADSDIKASLNYLAANSPRPVAYAYQPPAGVPQSTGTVEPHPIRIHDLRPLADQFTLDNAGFQLLSHQSAVENFWDEQELVSVYYRETIDLLKRTTGATGVHIFDHTLRRRVPDLTDDRAPGAPRQPAQRVHVDQTAASGITRLQHLFPQGADRLLRNRVAIVNVWRPIKSPVLDSPLAVCDARSVAPEDLVASDLLYRDRRGETYNVTHNPSHLWYYVPRMRSDEVLLLKCFDSRDDGAVARFAPHTAFIDPTAPRNAPPRESIEMRTYLFFGPQAEILH
jgi:hypothetical protein